MLKGTILEHQSWSTMTDGTRRDEIDLRWMKLKQAMDF